MTRVREHSWAKTLYVASSVEDVHIFAVGDGDWVVHNTDEICDLSQVAEIFEFLEEGRMQPVGEGQVPYFRENFYHPTAFNCHYCANDSWAMFKALNFDADIVRIQGLYPLSNLSVRNPDGGTWLLSNIDKKSWHEAVRIRSHENEFFFDSTVYHYTKDTGLYAMNRTQYSNLFTPLPSNGTLIERSLGMGGENRLVYYASRTTERSGNMIGCPSAIHPLQITTRPVFDLATGIEIPLRGEDGQWLIRK